jgi:hypothetical protein
VGGRGLQVVSTAPGEVLPCRYLPNATLRLPAPPPMPPAPRGLPPTQLPPSDCPVILCKTRAPLALSCLGFGKDAAYGQDVLEGLPNVVLSDAETSGDAIVAWNETDSTLYMLFKYTEERQDWWVGGWVWCAGGQAASCLSGVGGGGAAWGRDAVWLNSGDMWIRPT